MSDDDDDEEISPEESQTTKRRKTIKRNEFIDDEAELSGDDEVSEDEDELSDDDQLDPELVDQDAPDLDSDQEEEVRGLYLKQLETDDRRAVLLLREQLEDKNVSLGQRRRRKFKWQTQEMMENSLRRHYDPDDDDSHGEDDDELEDIDLEEVAPRLRRPPALGSMGFMSENHRPGTSGLSAGYLDTDRLGSGLAGISDDSNSNTTRIPTGGGGGVAKVSGPMDMNRFLYRDREVVEALSTRETVITTREEKDRIIEREIKRVLQSKSIFDQLYS